MNIYVPTVCCIGANAAAEANRVNSKAITDFMVNLNIYFFDYYYIKVIIIRRMDDDGWAKEREKEKRGKKQRKQFWLLGIDQFNSITYYACSKLENSHYVGIAASKPTKATACDLSLFN